MHQEEEPPPPEGCHHPGVCPVTEQAPVVANFVHLKVETPSPPQDTLPPPIMGNPPMEPGVPPHRTMIRVPNTQNINCTFIPPIDNNVTTTTPNSNANKDNVEASSLFKTGSLSVRKDMNARLPLFHTSNFRSNVKDLEASSCLVNELNLGSNDSSKIELCEGSMRVLNTPNVRVVLSKTSTLSYNSIFVYAGGNSVWSEVLSAEMLHALYGAKLLKTEMEIQYMTTGSITDFLVDLNGSKVGVSVTRAMKYRGRFSYEDAITLLNKKMSGVIRSSNNVTDEDKWEKQVLHVWVQEPYMVSLVKEAYSNMTDLHSNTLVLFTLCNNNLAWIFK